MVTHHLHGVCMFETNSDYIDLDVTNLYVDITVNFSSLSLVSNTVSVLLLGFELAGYG